MKKFFRNIMWLLVAGTSLGLLACSDSDQANEENEPEIYSLVETMYDRIGHESSCDKILSYLNGDLRMEKACTQYAESRSSKGINGDPKKLSHDMDNSGYYYAAYSLAFKLGESIDKCTGATVNTKEATDKYANVFKNTPGCEDFLDDARKVIYVK